MKKCKQGHTVPDSEKYCPIDGEKIESFNRKSVGLFLLGLIISGVFLFTYINPEKSVFTFFPFADSNIKETKISTLEATYPNSTQIEMTSTIIAATSSSEEKDAENTETNFENPTGTNSSDSRVSSIDQMSQIKVNGLWVDKTAITNSMFSKFVTEKNYKTDAEKIKAAYVWKSIGQISASWTKNQTYQGYEWKWTEGASWIKPDGMDDNAGDNDPVTQVSWNDAYEYCNWAGRRLITKQEWDSINNNAGSKQSSLVNKYSIGGIEFYDAWYGLAEWLFDSAQNEKVIEGRNVIYVSVHPFTKTSRNPTRSSNILTFRCVSD